PTNIFQMDGFDLCRRQTLGSKRNPKTNYQRNISKSIMGIVEAKKVFENFESIEEDFECIGLESGHINETYLIRNKKKKYILQKINSSIFPNLETIHSNIEIVAKHLESKNYAHKRIELLPFSNGKTIWENEWRIMHFIGNSIGFEKVNSANQCYEAAVFLSDFHSNLLDLDTKKIQNP